MSCTLDSKSLSVTNWGVSSDYLGSQSTVWQNGIVIRKVNVLSKVKVHRIECIEKNVAYSSSMVKYFDSKIDGSILNLNSTLNIYHTGGNVAVRVLGVSCPINSNEGNASIRRFTLTLQEVQPA